MVCSPYKTGYPTNTVKDNPQLSNLKDSGTSKLAWRYFKHNKVEKNELQVCKSLHKGTGTKMTEKLNNLTEKNRSFLFLCLYANLCEPGVHSYQLYCVQSTSSPILKPLVRPWGYLVGGLTYTVSSSVDSWLYYSNIKCMIKLDVILRRLIFLFLLVCYYFDLRCPFRLNLIF